MRRISCVFVVLLMTIAVPAPASSQEAGGGDPVGGQENGFHLEQNYPNPFHPETKIPFVLGRELFSNGRPVVVTIRIYNVLQQFVPSPTALDHPGADGDQIMELEYPAPGRYEAHWDGTDQSGQPVASGLYFVQLLVNGRSQIGKIYVAK